MKRTIRAQLTGSNKAIAAGITVTGSAGACSMPSASRGRARSQDAARCLSRLNPMSAGALNRRRRHADRQRVHERRQTAFRTLPSRPRCPPEYGGCGF
jgi:hypothetical protein